jgi:hypothetical protein
MARLSPARESLPNYARHQIEEVRDGEANESRNKQCHKRQCRPQAALS